MKRILIIFTLLCSISAFAQEGKAVKTDRNDISIEIGGGNVYYLGLSSEWSSGGNYVNKNEFSYSNFGRVSCRIEQFSLGCQLKYERYYIIRTLNENPYQRCDGYYIGLYAYERLDLIELKKFKLSYSIGVGYAVQEHEVREYPFPDNKLWDPDNFYDYRTYYTINFDFSLEFSKMVYNNLWIKVSPFYTRYFKTAYYMVHPDFDDRKKTCGLKIYY